MDCVLYINNSDARILNKKLVEIYPEDSAVPNFPINMLEDTSIIDPTFILGTATNVMKANYMFVPDLKRYYYIKDKILSKNRIYAQCHVDVLMSFKEAIKDTWAIMERQENNFDLYLNDSLISIENPNDIRTINFPSGFNESTNYLLIIAGDNSSGGGE